jgi:predicted membrane-bound spermidine synthase
VQAPGDFDRVRLSPFKTLLFVLFFISGFCGLLYQVIWTRMAFASFGIITPVLSAVISVFMLGLALGSWSGGRWVTRLTEMTGASAITLYGCVELMIAVGAFAVPKLFGLGEYLLLSSGETDSVPYLGLSALVLFFSILPWCFFMGATFPLMMAFIRERASENPRSFSYLYLANVLGAMSGTLLTGLVLIESFGFHATLRFAAAGNAFIALISFWLGLKRRAVPPDRTKQPERSHANPSSVQPDNLRWLPTAILFSTGFSTMAMEVVWTRAFTPVLKTQVYSFALILFTYLGATFAGSFWYRLDLRRGKSRSLADLISMGALAALIPVLVNDPRLINMTATGTIELRSATVILILLSICPLCAVLGYLTPSLIDNYSAGQPAEAGRAYALNVCGCILGPLFASYFLLPWMTQGNALAVLAAPFFVFYFLLCGRLPLRRRVLWGTTAFAVLIVSLFVSQDFETLLLKREKTSIGRRDYAASVVSFGTGFKRRLLVNGIGMTALTPDTKFMSHLPMAFHKGELKSALVICFGMGTSYRSALSWNVDTTVVELVPSVTKAFGFYHDDASVVRANPLGHIVIDDGRRYLNRTSARYDVIIIDPPPPIEAAGSSLLYSDEFYEVLKQHLNPGGIVQAWIPITADRMTREAVARSLQDSFPYVRCFGSIEHYGFHFLASMQPIESFTSSELLARMPETARHDLLEWASTISPADYLGKVVWNERFMLELLNPDSSIRVTDDRPFNEYFLMRRIGFR